MTTFLFSASILTLTLSFTGSITSRVLLFSPVCFFHVQTYNENREFMLVDIPDTFSSPITYPQASTQSSKNLGVYGRICVYNSKK